MRVFSTDNCLYKIGDGVRESVLVTDDVAGRPPLVDVRVSWFGHKNVAKTLSIFRVAPVEKFQSIHFFEIEKQRAAFARALFNSSAVRFAFSSLRLTHATRAPSLARRADRVSDAPPRASDDRTLVFKIHP